jgi:hypothetical protein
MATAVTERADLLEPGRGRSQRTARDARCRIVERLIVVPGVPGQDPALASTPIGLAHEQRHELLVPRCEENDVNGDR